MARTGQTVNLPRDAVPSTPLGVCLASDWQPHQPGEQRRGEVPLGPALPRVPLELWPVFQREWQWPCRAWSCCGLRWHLCFQKCLWPRLRGDSWVQIREEKEGQ